MSLVCTIHVDDEVNCRIGGLRPEHYEILSDKFAILVDGAWHMPAVQLRRWDGKIRFFEKNGKAYTKLLDEILTYLCAWGYDINLVDNRVPAPVITDRIDENFFGNGFSLRPYQVDVVNALLEEGSGFAICATGAGKCLSGDTLINIDVPEGPNQKMVNVTLTMSELFSTISLLKSISFKDEVPVNVSEFGILVNTPHGKQPVISLIQKIAPTSIIDFIDGTSIHCADHHRFMNGDQEIHAINLQPGDKIDAVEGSREVLNIRKGEVERVYDLEIGHPSHVYYTANGILHHNTSMCAALSMVLHLNGLQVLVIVPSTDLVAQTVSEFRDRLSAYPVTVGEYSGSAKDIDHPIVVATWQALQNVPHYMGFFGAFIVDECFSGDMRVLTPLGPIRIDQLKPGDHVYSSDLNGNLVVDEIVKVHTSLQVSNSEEMLELTFDEKVTIKVTANHKFYTLNRGWVRADELTEDDEIDDIYKYSSNHTVSFCNERSNQSTFK